MVGRAEAERLVEVQRVWSPAVSRELDQAATPRPCLLNRPAHQRAPNTAIPVGRVDAYRLNLSPLTTPVGERWDEGELERPHDASAQLGHHQELAWIGIDRLERLPVCLWELATCVGLAVAPSRSLASSPTRVGTSCRRARRNRSLPSLMVETVYGSRPDGADRSDSPPLLASLSAPTRPLTAAYDRLRLAQFTQPDRRHRPRKAFGPIPRPPCVPPMQHSATTTRPASDEALCTPSCGQVQHQAVREGTRSAQSPIRVCAAQDRYRPYRFPYQCCSPNHPTREPAVSRRRTNTGALTSANERTRARNQLIAGDAGRWVEALSGWRPSCSCRNPLSMKGPARRPQVAGRSRCRPN